MERSIRLPVICAKLYCAVFALTISQLAFAQTCIDNTNAVTVSTTPAAFGDAPITAIFCDLNGDGLEDLVTANDASDSVSVLLGDGSGGFDDLQQWPVGTAGTVFEPVGVACCDLDGDQRFDLITANHTSDDISILYNLGNTQGVPQFTAGELKPVGEAPFVVQCAPVDLDLHNDLVVANFTTDDVSVLINAGDGTFDLADAYNIPVGNGPRSLAICDVDGDMDNDFVTANLVSKDVTLLRNDGGAGLTDAGDFSVGVNPYDVACCEIDGEAGMDIVTANLVADTISVLPNNGSNSFGSPEHHGTADGAIAIACADLNGNGNQDVITANLSSDDIAIFLNDENGSLLSPSHIPVGNNPSFVGVADILKNGAPDLAVPFSNGARIYFNGCTADCTGDSDCPDDGDYCNGDEVCNAGSCESTGNPCVTPDAACWEDTDSCGPIGDLDRDGDRDLKDFTMLHFCYGLSSTELNCASADFNGDGTIDHLDYLQMVLEGP